MTNRWVFIKNELFVTNRWVLLINLEIVMKMQLKCEFFKILHQICQPKQLDIILHQILHEVLTIGRYLLYRHEMMRYCMICLSKVRI